MSDPALPPPSPADQTWHRLRPRTALDRVATGAACVLMCWLALASIVLALELMVAGPDVRTGTDLAAFVLPIVVFTGIGVLALDLRRLRSTFWRVTVVTLTVAGALAPPLYTLLG